MSEGKLGKNNNKKEALDWLLHQGIQADYKGKNWLKRVQGVFELNDEMIQTRFIQEGKENPPSINPYEKSDAQKVITWFEETQPTQNSINKIQAIAEAFTQKAKVESGNDSGKFEKTLKKILEANHSVEDLEETISTAYTQWSTNWRISCQAVELEKKLSLDQYPQLFPLARSLGREIEIFTGPTNSGKTYAGMQLLAQAQSGTYLAPLRLLAMEGQEAITERGITCSLVTGEERKLKEGAQFVASTVEMADFSNVVDVAVIDEAQMLADKDRGWAWTAAICGIPAKKVAIVCAPEAVGMVESLLARTGETYKIHRFERKNVLESVPKPISMGQITSGDALIVFSRKNALMWRDKIVASGRTVAVIYGALAPEVRRSEAKRFSEGNADILVATDAIGMGLNLPIQRIIFTTTSKFDGKEIRTLETQELRQISGRAGRYGIAEKGLAGVMEAEDCSILSKALKSGVTALDELISIAPNDRQIDQMSQVMKVKSLSPILCFFRDHLVKSDPLFKASEMEDMMDLASRADRRIGLNLMTRFGYAKTPLDRNDSDHVKVWESWMRSHESGQVVNAPTEMMTPKTSKDDDKLWEMERAMKLLSAYCWLSWRFESVFVEREKAEKARAFLSEKIETILSKMSSSKNVAESKGKKGVKMKFTSQGKKTEKGRSKKNDY